MQGAGLPIIGSILGHADHRATAIYARLQPDAGRQALDRFQGDPGGAACGRLRDATGAAGELASAAYHELMNPKVVTGVKMPEDDSKSASQ